MNLSSLVHAGRHQGEQQHFIHYNPRPQQIMASSLVANPYTTQHLPQNSSYTYVTAPQPPPSPPVDEASKCSLPSISSLLGGLPNESNPREPAQQQAPQVSQPQKVEYRPSSSHQYGRSPAISTRGGLPPTPPMHSESGFDDRQSPSAASNSGYSVVSAPSYYYGPSAINNGESQAQRQPTSSVPRRLSAPVPYSQPSFNASQYNASQMSSYYSSPMQSTPPQSQVSGLYYQRSLPQQFPPPLMPLSVTVTPSSGANPWQHHHYISPSSAAAFPQSQDRYICQTCNKAFSRPSSLRIHSHSHTGEKPFKCPHQGCGKAFSVRSNMKRHERGCHTLESSALLHMRD